MSREGKRVAVVTGANRGLGYAIVRRLAEQGLHVVLTARSEQAAERAAAKLRDKGLSISSHQLDVTDPASVVRVMADTGTTYGRLDVLVNNAAVAIDRGQQASAVDMEKVRATIDANLMGAWRCCTAAVPEMRKLDYGRIVNVTTHMSTFGQMGSGSVAYRVSKTGLNALTCILATELREANILVNAASPGKIDTRMAYGKAEQSPDEAADTFAWLATLPDDGPTGQLFHRREPLHW
ncbi:SDR family oxidoreductase [Salinispora arenicola]|uniref:NAD(P)-dependent dehydrogenase (Short-subunit alcohol dehydrogenase family) n=1 Tax=Salinispora arenicola TaxID=168697 RepID=A0A542XTJ3_SALAC|nr:SDR family oxidoreductase [Salinispora arenicola]MCN0154995.1 SDR family oxidoreductase [Salinispora arenicola]TQL39166.1 NAD(P)-dependent dehydrogenase (short-subunit alcohol dehydrogenase family) [Salinispora arenicola]GIM88078.1 short-chain dehydrogenase [Salinispora arenicola]